MKNSLIFLFVLLTVQIKPVFAAENLPDLPHQITSIISDIEKDKPTLQGGAIAILYKGKVVYKTTFGYARGKDNPITEDTLFPLASASKSVVASAVSLMVEDGKLDIDQEIKLPYLHDKLTLKNIMTHTTGYKYSGNSQIEKGMSRQQLLSYLKQHKPSCKPGKCYFYSNLAYSLVDEALHQNKQSLALAIETLREKLHTDGISILPLNSSMQVAYPHLWRKEGNKALPFPPYYPKSVTASAGVFASLNAMIKWLQMQSGYRPDLTSQKILDQFQKSYVSNNEIAKYPISWPVPSKDIESYYGLGWRIFKFKNYPNHDLIFHPGFISGITSFIGFIPSEEVGIIILLNEQSKFAFQTGIDFWGSFIIVN